MTPANRIVVKMWWIFLMLVLMSTVWLPKVQMNHRFDFSSQTRQRQEKQVDLAEDAVKSLH